MYGQTAGLPLPIMSRGHVRGARPCSVSTANRLANDVADVNDKVGNVARVNNMVTAHVSGSAISSSVLTNQTIEV